MTAASVVMCPPSAASFRLRFDLRLEIGGVLVSWSVPKGPSTNPDEKRLAIRTEDHPLEYADFEGRIPADEYGGGTVIVWDTGTFDNRAEHSAEQALDEGHLRVWLHDAKLTGAYSLLRTRMGETSDEEQWLLVKRSTPVRIAGVTPPAPSRSPYSADAGTPTCASETP